MELTDETNDLLKIDEIIPLFDPNMKIEIFKEKICESLKDYN